MHTNRPPRLKHFDYTGFHRYSVTFCTDRRRPVLKDSRLVSLGLSQISRAASETDFAVITYCFMPDHVHLLVHGDCEAADFKRFVILAKQYSGYYYSKQTGGKLWQRYGYERTLRKEEDTLIVARYIVENPLRAGLVKRIEEYPFVGSLVCEMKDLLASLGERGG